MEEKKYCRKCLLRDMDKDGYFKNLREYIDNLDKDIKASPEEYERRLALCKECDNLIDGMCKVCGCYVELRAAISNNRCPAVHELW